MSKRMRTGGALEYRIDADLTHRSIAMTCIAYLLRFDNPGGLDRKRLEEHPDIALVSYAGRHWIWHCLRCLGEDNDQLLQLLIQELFHPRHARFLNWVRIYNLDTGQYQYGRPLDIATFPNPLYYSCHAGLLEVSEWLLSQCAEVNATGGNFTYPLIAACAGGHTEIVRLLLDRGADVDTEGGGINRTALQAACTRGNKTIVDMLLNRGADVNAEGGVFGPALQVACKDGHDTIVQLLLDWGADVNVNMEGGIFGTALQAACYGVHETTVRLLLDRGADVNAEGVANGTPLQAVCAQGHEPLVRLLIDQGAEPKDGDTECCMFGRQRGYRAITLILLGRGASVSVHGRAESALQAACRGGHVAIVKLLLETGAEVNTRGGHYETALQAACSTGGNRQEEVVRLLLDNGADVNARGDRYETALQAACAGGGDCQGVVIRSLLDNGADVNARGGCYEIALQAACAEGVKFDGRVVRLLLDRGAEPDTQGGWYGNALQAALTHDIFWSQDEAAKMMWDAGARLGTMSSAAWSHEHLSVWQPSPSGNIWHQRGMYKPVSVHEVWPEEFRQGGYYAKEHDRRRSSWS